MSELCWKPVTQGLDVTSSMLIRYSHIDPMPCRPTRVKYVMTPQALSMSLWASQM